MYDYQIYMFPKKISLYYSFISKIWNLERYITTQFWLFFFVLNIDLFSMVNVF